MFIDRILDSCTALVALCPRLHIMPPTTVRSVLPRRLPSLGAMSEAFDCLPFVCFIHLTPNMRSNRTNGWKVGKILKDFSQWKLFLQKYRIQISIITQAEFASASCAGRSFGIWRHAAGEVSQMSVRRHTGLQCMDGVRHSGGSTSRNQRAKLAKIRRLWPSWCHLRHSRSRRNFCGHLMERIM